MKYPSIWSIFRLCISVKGLIRNESRAFKGDEKPGILLNIVNNPETGDWGYRINDESFIGESWASVIIYHNSSCLKTAAVITEQLREGVE